MTKPPQGEPSSREAEVLAALGDRLSNAQIANRLGISVRTVEGHVSALLRKYQVTHRGELATLAGTAASPTGIVGVPAARTSFFGRVREHAEVLAAIRRQRLVTVVGPGGVGKTRLAGVVAADAEPLFPFGGAFVDLVAARDDSVLQTVAAVAGVTENIGQSLVDAIAGRFSHGRSLLVMDNCEHVLGGVTEFVDAMLDACPSVTVLATSRERLGLAGEQVISLGPLPLGSEAEQLFEDRAALTGHDVDPALVIDVCARLDGLPLAIELAAARSRSLGAAGLAAGLDDSLRLLAGGRGTAVRHRSLRSTIAWSHDLLDHDEQALFHKLAVFAGRFDLAAVVAVTGAEPAVVADLLGRLTDKSLLTPADASGRWGMLVTIRAFAGERLGANGSLDPTHRRHFEWAVATANALCDRLDGQWHADFAAVADDLRAALARQGHVPSAHALARSLGCLTFARRFFAESREHYRTAAMLAADPADALRDGRNAAAAAMKTSGRRAAFQDLMAVADRTHGTIRARALAHAVAITHRFSGDPTDLTAERAAELLDEATALADKDDAYTAALLATARAWASTPDINLPRPDLDLSRAAVVAAERAGDPVLLMDILDALGVALADVGQLRAANEVALRRLPLVDMVSCHEPHVSNEIRDTYLMVATHRVGASDFASMPTGQPVSAYVGTSEIIALVLVGAFDDALCRADAMWESWQRNGRPPMKWVAAPAYATALAYGLLDDDVRCELWRGRALTIAEVSNAADSCHLDAFAAFTDARLAVHRGPGAAASTVVEKCAGSLPDPWYVPYARAAGAELAVVAGLPDAREHLDRAAAAAAENEWAEACLLRATGRFTEDSAMLRAAADKFERIGARFEHADTLRLLGHE